MNLNSQLMKDVLAMRYLIDEDTETESVNEFEIFRLKEITDKSKEYLK